MYICGSILYICGLCGITSPGCNAQAKRGYQIMDRYVM